MNQFISYIKPFFNDNPQSLDILLEHTVVHTYRRDIVYCREDEERPYWCYVIDGLVGAYQLDAKKPYLHWVAGDGHYFTGTKHEYSFNSQSLRISFLKKSKLASIPLPIIQMLQDQDPTIRRFVSILRQRKSTFFDLKALVAYDPTMRYAKLCEHLPRITDQLNNIQLSAFLAIDRKTLYESKREALFGRP
ncbi:hypothetical protein FAZ19_09605 [Sphingobacterium alkalisoli]|uniref:Crp/Fnr family transcriptional regulator n=1 Tax=Sphingobacterium alkalisoli TaxID=1874115 RepID=A0A4U0H5Y4_9SPHI|nr:hypothetical protein [Sphingobacterium alkalisoli]TJY67130.1 hypothetical protein FAZ19_09605 [Sphingobacterium alkalisoli]GGH12039.1 hypothetical protein GCM10011418_11290 [Sphingobacterium alkalisoli]